MEVSGCKWINMEVSGLKVDLCVWEGVNVVKSG